MKTVYLENRNDYSAGPRVVAVVREGCPICGETKRTHLLWVEMPEIVSPHELADILRRLAKILDKE